MKMTLKEKKAEFKKCLEELRELLEKVKEGKALDDKDKENVENCLSLLNELCDDYPGRCTRKKDQMKFHPHH